MNMKTVWDAVSELEGDFNCDGLGTEEHFNQVICTNCAFDGYSSGFVTTGSGVKDNKYWTVICTKEEFNELVHEMKSNFYEYNMNGVTNYQIALAEGNVTKLEVESKVDKPVYTQEMYDKGEKPKAGMICLVDGVHRELLLPIDSDDMGVIKVDGAYYIICLSALKPTDVRTEKEKAIDDVYRSDLTVKENLAEAYDAWSKGNE